MTIPPSARYGRLRGSARTALATATKANLSAYSFRPATTNDLPRLRRWLHAPKVKRWWGEPRKQFELSRANLNEPRTTMRIVSFKGRLFAYARDYEVRARPQAHLAPSRKDRWRSTTSSVGG
jgi:RimJ/RimL family protein N-acetyltransferase